MIKIIQNVQKNKIQWKKFQKKNNLIFFYYIDFFLTRLPFN